jgi:U3 small nucleolar RNA-associated protein 22
MPGRNCIRKSIGDLPGHTSDELPPTPLYNATIMSECSVASYLKLLHQISSRCEPFKDACTLGRLWLQQRGLQSGKHDGGFGNFEWAALTTVLLQGGGPSGNPILSLRYSAYQMFKAVIKFLASRHLVEDPLFYDSEPLQGSKGALPIFYDGPRNINILFKMTAWSYSMVSCVRSLSGMKLIFTASPRSGYLISYAK